MTGSRAAVVFGIGVLVAFGLNLGLVFKDRLNRRSLEKVSEETAVGDVANYPRPKLVNTSEVVVTFGGQPLYPAESKTIDLRDYEMRRAGRDDSGRYVLYTSSIPSEKDLELTGYYFLKTGPDEYLRLEPSK